MTKVVQTFCEACSTRRLWCRQCHVRRCDCRPSRCPCVYVEKETGAGTWQLPTTHTRWCKTRGQRPSGKTGGIVIMQLGKAKRRMASRKAAEILHATGKAYHWDRETAAKAARKRWKKVKRSKRLGGMALGLKLKKRKATDRMALRLRYADTPVRGVWFDTETRKWWTGWETETHRGARVLSERAALVRLGHLPSGKVYIPEEILRDPVGKQRAEGRNNDSDRMTRSEGE